MSDALYLLPDAALALVLARMRWVGLDRARRAEWLFLYAWLVYSLLTLYSQHPLLHFAPWLFAAAPLARASLRITSSPLALAALAAPVPAALALHAFGSATAEFAAVCLAASTAGGVFVVASFRAAADSPERTIWRGAGVYFLLLGTILPLPAAFAPGLYPLLLLASAAVWLALAWFIAPTPDAIFNSELLAISPDVPPGRAPLAASHRDSRATREPAPPAPVPALFSASRLSRNGGGLE